jgi:hypothetical protein
MLIPLRLQTAYGLDLIWIQKKKNYGFQLRRGLTSARYIDAYKIEIRFNNDREGIVDLFETLEGKVFKPLTFTRVGVIQTILS